MPNCKKVFVNLFLLIFNPLSNIRIKIDLGKPRIPEGLSIHYTALYSAVQHHLTDGQGQNFNFNKIMPAVLRERVVIPPPSPGRTEYSAVQHFLTDGQGQHFFDPRRGVQCPKPIPIIYIFPSLTPSRRRCRPRHALNTVLCKTF